MEESSRRPTPDHPPYSEMVQCAIRDLAEDHGSTEPAISDYIRAHYDSLPSGHSRLLPYYLHKLLLDGEITGSPLPNRYTLPSNPNPNTTRKLGRPRKPDRKPKRDPAWPSRGRGRRRKVALPEPTCRGPEPVSTPKSGPRLVLKLKRSSAILVDPQGGVYAGSGWRCLREDTQVHGENLEASEGGGHAEEDLDGVAVDVPEEDLNGITIDEHYDELLALRESDLNGIKTDRHGEEFMTLQDEELNGITIDELGKDLEIVKSKEHAEELSAMQKKDSNGSRIHGSNDGLLASLDDDLNGTKTDLHDKEFMSLRDEEPNHITIDGHSKDLAGVEREEDAEELSAIQERESAGIKIDGGNEELLTLQGCSHVNTGPTESVKGKSHKKATKPRKSRRLWYER